MTVGIGKAAVVKLEMIRLMSENDLTAGFAEGAVSDGNAVGAVDHSVAVIEGAAARNVQSVKDKISAGTHFEKP